MVKFKITYKNPEIPIPLKKLVKLRAKTPEEAWGEIKRNIKKHNYLMGDIGNLRGIEQQESSS